MYAYILYLKYANIKLLLIKKLIFSFKMQRVKILLMNLMNLMMMMMIPIVLVSQMHNIEILYRPNYLHILFIII